MTSLQIILGYIEFDFQGVLLESMLFLKTLENGAKGVVAYNANIKFTIPFRGILSGRPFDKPGEIVNKTRLDHIGPRHRFLGRGL